MYVRRDEIDHSVISKGQHQTEGTFSKVSELKACFLKLRFLVRKERKNSSGKTFQVLDTF
jgi:hypothetical protein